MRGERKPWVQAAEIALGAVLIAGSERFGWRSEWLGMGAALVAVGLLNLLRSLRYVKDADYRERYDTETKDERNVYIRQMAWVWAGTAFILVAGVLSIVFLILKNELMTTVVSSGMCLLLVLYWASYLILRKKY